MGLGNLMDPLLEIVLTVLSAFLKQFAIQKLTVHASSSRHEMPRGAHRQS